MNTHAKIATTALLAFALAGCGESQYDLDRKGDLIDKVVDNSMENCLVVEPAQRDSNYETRLRTVLLETESQAMDFILENKITVCLDARIPQQTTAFFDTPIYAVLHGGANPTVALLDNGMVGSGTALFELDTNDDNNIILDKLPEYVRDGDISLTKGFSFSSRYGCGKSCTTIRWKDQYDFDKDTVRKNQNLLTAPLKATIN